MQFILTNFSFKGSKVLENELDSLLFKDIAFGSKTVTKNQNNQIMYYNRVLVPISEGFQLPKDDFYKRIKNSIERNSLNADQIESLIGFMELLDIASKNPEIKFSIYPMAVLNHEEIGIGYSDGSFKKSNNSASYACVKLLKEDSKGTYDSFSDQYYTYESYNDVIKEGTNNIGELSGIKKLVELFDDKKYQVIISDSEYGLKCYREWIYNWEKNGYKTYSKKPILNQDLIKETQKLLNESGKIVMFKWVRGHNNNSFNELCDTLAKDILNI